MDIDTPLKGISWLQAGSGKPLGAARQRAIAVNRRSSLARYGSSVIRDLIRYELGGSVESSLLGEPAANANTRQVGARPSPAAEVANGTAEQSQAG